MNKRHVIKSLKDDSWEVVEYEHAYSTVSWKKMMVRVRFDGYGNSVVSFVVANKGRETDYEKYNSAVTAYNLLP